MAAFELSSIMSWLALLQPPHLSLDNNHRQVFSLEQSRDPLYSPTYQALYDITGYGYVLAWSISFYPQLILNWKRKSTAGMSVGLVWYNLLGFTLYLFYTMFALDCAVQDMMFAGHALLMTILSLAQVKWYETNTLGEFPQIHGKIAGLLLLALDVCLVLNVGRWTSFLSLVYACGYLKTTISLVKYTPQLYLNWARKTTQGFAISFVLFDMTGGVLSILQQFIACKYSPITGNLRGEWTWEPFRENKPKTLLGVISVFYDLCFIYQHYVMYKAANSAPKAIAACAACGSALQCDAQGALSCRMCGQPRGKEQTSDDGPCYKRAAFRPAMPSARLL